MFFNSDQDQLEEKYMWIRAYAMIYIIHSKSSDNQQIMKNFIELMEVTKKYKFFPSVAFSSPLKNVFLNLLPNDPRLKFFTFISNKMYKTAFKNLEFPKTDDEEWGYFRYLVMNLKKNLKVLIDAPEDLKFVNIKEPNLVSTAKSTSQKMINNENSETLMNSLSSINPKKLFN